MRKHNSQTNKELKRKPKHTSSPAFCENLKIIDCYLTSSLQHQIPQFNLDL